jgi:polyhydroxyalkanoate synthase
LSGLPGDNPDRWLETAESRPGSWWSHWSGWLAQHGGEKVPARSRLGGDRCTEIEPAPGRYVKEKAGPMA